MTPRERADQAREALGRLVYSWSPASAQRNVDELLPPGSIILTAEEATFVSEELEWRQHWADCAKKPTGPNSFAHPAATCTCKYGQALALLGGDQ